MILYTLSHPNVARLQQCLALMSEKDSLLFLEDGVTFAAKKEAVKLLQNQNVYILKHDCQARAMTSFITKSMQLIDDETFVKLTLTHDKTIRWV